MVSRSMFRSKFFLLIFFLVIAQTYAQQIRGRVVDSESGAELEDVDIVDINQNIAIVTNKNGEFILTKLGNYKFNRIGYKSKDVIITNANFIIIQLEPISSLLNEVIISTDQIPKSLKKIVYTTEVLSAKEINRGNSLSISPVLNRVPGVFMQSGALNTNRITIRGIGSRNLYGTAKIRAYFGDIPLTTGNGETSVDDLDLSSISRFEIVKGASSSIYGAGLGGTIHILPRNSMLNNSQVEGEFTLGSFGLQKKVISANYGAKQNSFRTVYTDTHIDGYRDNNEYNRKSITYLSNHFLGKDDQITILAGYIDLKAYIPSSVNEITYLENPENAAFIWKRAKGHEDMKKGLIGISWNHEYSNDFKHITSIFSSYRDGYEPRPFNILSDNILAYGLRTRVLKSVKFWKWTLGIELFSDRYLYKTFENLYNDFPDGTGSISGMLLSNFKEKRKYYNIFSEANFDLSKKTIVSFGLNFNKTSYRINDRAPDIDGLDQSGNYQFKAILSPKVGISHQLNEDISIYGNINHGFSPPTTNETLLPDGNINTNIQPEQGWSFEVGSRGSFFNSDFAYNITLYSMDIRDLLVARRTAEDEFVGINAGRTLHQGLETNLRYNILNKDKLELIVYFTGTFNNFDFKDFVDDDSDFSGNKLTGVPSEIINTGLDLITDRGFYGNINYQYISSFPMNDANSLFNESYDLINSKIGYQHKFNEKVKLNIFFGLNNIFNKKYASQILINAQGFGGRAPRYYYPGNPRNYFSGINFNYTF